MNINWKIKSAIFGTIDLFRAKKILYFIQKYITKRSKVNIDNVYRDSLDHINSLKKIRPAKILEFGGGKSLAQNIIFSQFVKEQVVVDLNNMIDFSLLNMAASKISEVEQKVDFKLSSSADELQVNYGIKYIAPLDVSKSNFRDNYFD